MLEFSRISKYVFLEFIRISRNNRGPGRILNSIFSLVYVKVDQDTSNVSNFKETKYAQLESVLLYTMEIKKCKTQCLIVWPKVEDLYEGECVKNATLITKKTQLAYGLQRFIGLFCTERTLRIKMQLIVYLCPLICREHHSASEINKKKPPIKIR